MNYGLLLLCFATALVISVGWAGIKAMFYDDDQEMERWWDHD